MLFTKMHGTANDYVVVSALAGPPPTDVERLARDACDRRRGIGADGLVVLVPHPGADAEMRMHNPDGSYSAMCGNALRCVGKFLYERAGLRKPRLNVVTGERRVTLDLSIEADRVVRVAADLGSPAFAPAEVPTTLGADGQGFVRDAPLEVAGHTLRFTCVSMGNPHAVTFRAAGEPEPDVLGLGPLVEHHAAFPQRTNVEFVEVLSRSRLRQRTWERGAGETLACGSGACAVAVAASLGGLAERRVTIELLGGEVEVEWREGDGHVVLAGPAVEVFRGEWGVAAERIWTAL
ncbi:MAG: diaminopimelate epimerase [Lacipirellulaceae bacterium]